MQAQPSYTASYNYKKAVTNDHDGSVDSHAVHATVTSYINTFKQTKQK